MQLFKKVFCLIIFFIIILNFSMPVEALSGLITGVNLEQKAIQVKGKWFFLQENTEVSRNNLISSLKCCSPIGGRYYQWADLTFTADGYLQQIDISYQVVEGVIKKIDTNRNLLKVKVWETPEISGGLHTYSLDYVQNSIKFNQLKNGKEIVMICAGKRLLYINWE